jgi:short-subunit dehydrogenase
VAAPLERVARTMRHIAISGASRRLGAALAQRFAAPGTRLSLTARSAEALTKVAALCQVAGAEVEVLACDIRDPASLAPALLAFDDAAPVDLIIANAGTSSGSSLEGEPEAYGAAINQIEVNLIGAMALIGPLEHVAFTWVHATRSRALFFEHLHAFR